MFRFVCRAGIAGLVWASAACTESVRLGRDLGADRAGASGAAGVAGVGGTASGGTSGGGFPIGGAPTASDAGPVRPAPADAGPCVQRPCRGVLRACGNCGDDDGDDSIDESDPDCLGPCDDSEGELFNGTAINVTGSCNADCYFSFDGNEGSGDDGCEWSYRCDPGSVDPSFFPTEQRMCEHDPALVQCDPDGPALAACQASCLPLTPNGCDCFGCCELPASSGNFIWLGSGLDRGDCELSTSADPALCRPCTPVQDCQNPCDECELCVGKSVLPAACGASGPACPEAVRSCDPVTSIGCGDLEYCITGCCIPLPS